MVAYPAGALRDGGWTEPGLQTLWHFFSVQVNGAQEREYYGLNHHRLKHA